MVNLRAVNPWHLFKQAQQVLAAQCILCFHQWICIGNERCSFLPSLQQRAQRVGDAKRASSTPREQENWNRSRFGNLQLLSNDASPHL